MKMFRTLLLGLLAYDVANASVANLLADRALTKLTSWIDSEGPDWLTLPGYYRKIQDGSNDGALSFAGPTLEKIGAITRSGEAELTDGEPDPSYETSQTLKFVASFRNVTLDYDHVSYNGAANGVFNLTSRATSDGVSVEVAIDLKGHGDSCMAFANSMDVSYNGSLWVTVMNLPASQQTVIVDAVKHHFESNIPKSIGTLMESATFDSLEYYDICTGVYYPQSPPNVLADSVLSLTSDGLRRNISDWATLPPFSKTALVNDTNLDVIKVGPGNFTSFGQIRRVGSASYENQVNSKLMNLNVSFEVVNLTAAYGNIEYIDYTIWFPIAELVTASKIETTLTITFTRKTPDSTPSCLDGSVAVTSQYSSDGSLQYANLTPDVPHYAIRSANEVLGPGFIKTVEAAANELFINATKHALKKMCAQ